MRKARKLKEKTAWLYYFKYCIEGAWLELHLKNDEVLLGKYSSKSFSSDENIKKDLLLEEVYTLNNNKKEWKQIPNAKLWINEDSINYIIIRTFDE